MNQGGMFCQVVNRISQQIIEELQFDFVPDTISKGIIGLCSDATAGLFYAYDQNSIFQVVFLLKSLYQFLTFFFYHVSILVVFFLSGICSGWGQGYVAGLSQYEWICCSSCTLQVSPSKRSSVSIAGYELFHDSQSNNISFLYRISKKFGSRLWNSLCCVQRLSFYICKFLVVDDCWISIAGWSRLLCEWLYQSCFLLCKGKIQLRACILFFFSIYIFCEIYYI